MNPREKTIQAKINRLGSLNPECCIPGCGVTDIVALKPVRKNQLTRKQRTLLEEHHVIGLHEGGTIILCLNHHARLSFEQALWSDELNKKDRGPAAIIFTFPQAVIDCLPLLCSDERVHDFSSQLWGIYVEKKLKDGVLNEVDFQKLAVEAQKLIEGIAQGKCIDPELFPKFAEKFCNGKILIPNLCNCCLTTVF